MRPLSALFRRDAPARKPGKAERPGRRGIWTRRTLVWAPAALTVVTLVAGPVWAWHTGRLQRTWDGAAAATLAASARAGLAVDRIVVEGRRNTARSAVLSAVGATRGDPILAVDPNGIRARLTALPWVRAARVERLLPDRLAIHLVERRPMALWQKGGKLALIDDSGVVVTRARLERFRHLPIVVGDDAPAHARVLLELLAAEPDLRARVAAAVRVGERRWNVRLKNGIDIRLPESGVADAWARLADLERKHDLLSREIESVDLRIPDRLILRTRAGPAPLPPPKGRRT